MHDQDRSPVRMLNNVWEPHRADDEHSRSTWPFVLDRMTASGSRVERNNRTGLELFSLTRHPTNHGRASQDDQQFLVRSMHMKGTRTRTGVELIDGSADQFTVGLRSHPRSLHVWVSAFELPSG